MTPGRWRAKPKVSAYVFGTGLLFVVVTAVVLFAFRDMPFWGRLYAGLEMSVFLWMLAAGVEAVSRRIRGLREPVAEDELMVTAELCREAWWTSRSVSGKLFWEDDRLIFHSEDVSLAIGSGDVLRVSVLNEKLRVVLKDRAGITFSAPGRRGQTMFRMFEHWLNGAPPATSLGESVPLTRR